MAMSFESDLDKSIKIAVLAKTSWRCVKLFNGSLAGRISELQGDWGRDQLPSITE
jgi:hypothetical protein